MHVKYASRHVLYPVPKVLDCATFNDTVARAGRVALRTMDEFVALRARDVVGVALRAIGVDVVARATVALRAARAVVAVRAALRCVVVVRAVTLAAVLRLVFSLDVFWDAVRSTVFCAVVARVMDFALRSAALVMPTPHISAITKNATFFIPVYN